MAGYDYSENGTMAVIELTDADTEYPFPLPDGVKRFEFQARQSADVRWSLVSGKVADSTDPYRTLKADRDHYEDRLFINKQTLYFASPVAGTVIELLYWL